MAAKSYWRLLDIFLRWDLIYLGTIEAHGCMYIFQSGGSRYYEIGHKGFTMQKYEIMYLLCQQETD